MDSKKIEKSSERLKEIRKNLNITQKQLAKSIGVSVPTIAKIEQEERYGSDDTWKKILNYYNEEKSK